MNKRSLRILEFNKILSMVTEYATSPMAKRRVDRMKPQRDIEQIRKLQEETNDALNRLNHHGNISFSGLCDIGASIKRLEVQGTLTSKELLDIAAVLQVAKAAKQYGDGSDLTEALASRNQEPVSQTTFDSLTERFNMLLPLEHIASEINRCILSENEYADDASSGLKNIRREIRLTNDKLHQQLDKIIKSDANRDQLQDSLITMRNGRYCIPVKQEYRSKFPGMIHDQSSTGSTLFIEPMAVVNLNNQIKELANEELLEIEKILESLSAQAATYVSDIAYDLELLTDLDFIFAKAKFARATNSTRPIFNTDGIIDIRQGRHPLLEKHTVVPVDIRLGETYNLLIITGPNTGGKTVSLKTVGLFTLMGQAGLHIPAQDNSEAAVFHHIFADIGDEQSIEQSLSTFSSHMVNTVSILENIDFNSLALFDELGAGTDPTEGAALAISILEFLRARKATTVATTHYSELKLFALSTDGVENASCEFDVATLQPTYKLLIGVPGKSNAFAISRRLGLDERIIDRANDILSDEDIKFEDVITDLEQNRAKARKEADEAARMKRELTDLRKQIENDRIKLKENKSRILDEARREAKILVMDAKDEANSIIRDLEKMRQQGISNGGNLDKKTSAMRDKLKKKEDTIDKAMARAAKPKKTYVEPPKNLKPGATVKIVDMNQEATVLKEPDKNGNVRVQAGIIKMDVHITNLRKVEEKKSKELAEKYVRSTRAFESKSKNVSTEVDVRGQNLEEAWMNVEKFLDDCYLAGISPVSIIHGKGTGILRKGLQGYMKKHRYVKSFRNGRYGEGEDGVTIVELK